MQAHARLLYALAAALLCFAVAGCTTHDQWHAAAASMRLEYGGGTGELDRGKRDWDTSGTWLAVSVQPLAYLDMQMRAQKSARAAAEAMYARFQEEQECAKPKPESGPTHSCGSK